MATVKKPHGKNTRANLKPAHISDADYDTMIGRSHLKELASWPPPMHILEYLNTFVAFIEDNLATGTILDLGCGDGAIDMILAEHSPKRKITGIDLEAHVQWKLPTPANLTFQAESIYDLPFNPKSFDIVMMKDVLHHMPDPEKTLHEVAKLAKKQVLVIEANRYNPVSFIRMVKIAKHEHFSQAKLKKIVGRPATLITTETHVWPGPTRIPGKINDVVFNSIPLLSKLRNYNFIIFEP